MVTFLIPEDIFNGLFVNVEDTDTCLSQGMIPKVGALISSVIDSQYRWREDCSVECQDGLVGLLSEARVTLG